MYERCTHHWRCLTEGEGALLMAPFEGLYFEDCFFEDPFFVGPFYKMDADMPLHEPLRGHYQRLVIQPCQRGKEEQE